MFSAATCLKTESHGPDTGEHQMAWDEAMLEQVRLAPQTKIFLARTFLWAEPTWSLGVHQPPRDREALLKRCGATPVVSRPTGGRAILHGEDVSFSLITNDPLWLGVSIKESYCWVTGWLKMALQTCGVPLQADCGVLETLSGSTAYTRSAQCFETTMPSDILDANGRKIVGSAQLRRSGGLLLQGAAFLAPYGVTPTQFSAAWFQAVRQADASLRHA